MSKRFYAASRNYKVNYHCAFQWRKKIQTERKKSKAKYFLCFHYLKNVGSKLHVLLAYCSMDHASWCSSVVVSSTNYLKLQRAMRFMCIHQYACCIYWAKLSRIKYAMNWLFRWPCVDFFPAKLTHIPSHTGNAVVYIQKNMHTTSIWQSKVNSICYVNHDGVDTPSSCSFKMHLFHIHQQRLRENYSNNRRKKKKFTSSTKMHTTTTTIQSTAPYAFSQQ